MVSNVNISSVFQILAKLTIFYNFGDVMWRSKL